MFMDYIGKHDSTWKLKEEKTKAIVKRSSEIIFLYPSGLICPWVLCIPYSETIDPIRCEQVEKRPASKNADGFGERSTTVRLRIRHSHRERGSGSSDPRGKRVKRGEMKQKKREEYAVWSWGKK